LIKATIEKAVLRSKMPTRRAEAPEVAQMKDFGADLFRVLFAEEVRACYAQSQAIARQQGKGLRLKLRLDPSLAGLPWEFLYSRERRDFVILSRYNPIVRYTELKIPSEPLRVTPPLRLLVVIASPQEDRYYASLDTEREKQRILAALADLQETGVVTVDFLEGANSFRRLTHLLRREEYYILHFVGHGDYDKEHQEGVLVMEDEDRRGMWVGAQSLGRLLRDVTATRLAILNACVGAVASPADPFSSVAASLVGVGVPAVIAMQFEISDGAAITLAHEFYTALADNFPVDAALAEARKQISFDDPDSLEWATPVLYMRAPDGMLFDLAAAKEVVAAAREKAARRKEERQRQEKLAILYDETQKSLEAENWSEAIARCNEILAIDPSYRDAATLLVEAKKGLAHQEKEEKLAHLYNEAMGSSRRGNWQEAIDKLQQVLGLEEGYKDAVVRLAAALEELAKVGTEKERDKLAALYEQVVAAMNAKQWQEAIQHCDDLVAMDASYRDVAQLRTQAEAALQAEQQAKERRKKKQEDLFRLYKTAHTALSAQDWEETLKQCQEIESLEPGYRDVAQIRAQAQAKLRERRETEERARQEKLARLYDELQAALKAKRYEDAIRHCADIAAIDANYRDVAQLRAQAEATLRDDREAEEQIWQEEHKGRRVPSWLWGIIGLVVLAVVGLAGVGLDALLSSNATPTPLIIIATSTPTKDPYEGGQHELSALQQIGGVAGTEPGQFQFPRALAVGSDGTIYVADTGNHRVQVLRTDGTFVREWGTEGSG
jgi:outer membrane protein assembly factor BamD (BamD/ComL family)